MGLDGNKIEICSKQALNYIIAKIYEAVGQVEVKYISTSDKKIIPKGDGKVNLHIAAQDDPKFNRSSTILEEKTII
ncbi:hypothetical protein ACJX0J_008912, partial [Zea mays]